LKKALADGADLSYAVRVAFLFSRSASISYLVSGLLAGRGGATSSMKSAF
jgi:hypothetical protein